MRKRFDKFADYTQLHGMRTMWDGGEAHVGIDLKDVLDLISIAEKAEENGTAADYHVCHAALCSKRIDSTKGCNCVPSVEKNRPETAAEEILEILASEKNIAWKGGPWYRTGVALAEAVEWIEESRSFDCFCGDKTKVPLHEKATSSILAILKGEKKREIPK